jgi:hypothetical protein
LIDRDRNPKGLLERGERKSLQTDRVILVPGPELEIETVRQIYELFVVQGKTEREIMENLNGRGVFGELGRPWTRASVHQVLINPKYIGANVYNRRSFKLKYKRVKNPVQMWIGETAPSNRSSRLIYLRKQGKSSNPVIAISRMRNSLRG